MDNDWHIARIIATKNKLSKSLQAIHAIHLGAGLAHSGINKLHGPHSEED